jgi:filamentous hemagglutinin
MDGRLVMMFIIKRLKVTTLLGLLSGLGFGKTRHLHPDAASTYGSENLDRMSKGLAPQRYNADKGGVESMELSHEPIPARDGGKDFVPRWPQDHAAVDPYRKPGY